MTAARAGTLRHVVLIALRSLAVVLILIGAYALFQGLVLWARDEFDFDTIFLSFDRGFSWSGRALGFLAPGVALAIGSRRLSRWIVPAPPRECLRCGHPTRGLVSDRCPECGGAIDGAEAPPRSREP